MNQKKLSKIKERIIQTIVLSTIGMKGDRLRIKVRVRFVNNGDAITSTITGEIRRIIFGDEHEARGNISLSLKLSNRAKGKNARELLSELDIRKVEEKIDFNMDFYLTSIYSYGFRDAVKQFNDYLSKRDGKATPLIPPLALDFKRVLDERVEGFLSNLERISEMFRADSFVMEYLDDSKVSGNLIAESIGRVLRMLALEYSNHSHLKEIERALKRLGGVEETELKRLSKKWVDGVRLILEMAINCLIDSPLEDEQFRNSLFGGLSEGAENRIIEQLFNVIFKLSKKHLDRGGLPEKLKVIMKRLGLTELDDQFIAINEKLDSIIELLKGGEIRKALEIVKNDRFDISKGFVDNVMEFDNEEVMAALIFIYHFAKGDIDKLLDLSSELMYRRRNILGVIVYALKAIRDRGDKELIEAYNELSKQVAYFTYSQDVKKYPNNIIVSEMYLLLSIIASRLGQMDASKRALNVAERIFPHLKLSRVVEGGVERKRRRKVALKYK